MDARERARRRPSRRAIFFTQALVLSKHFGVRDARVGLFIVPLALRNLLGPVLLGTLFDRIGRKVMIATSFIAAGTLLVPTVILSQHGILTTTTLTAASLVVFLIASSCRAVSGSGKANAPFAGVSSGARQRAPPSFMDTANLTK